MTSPALVRVPDQFRPSRDHALVATPTCCCCCCCLMTIASASAALPSRLELKRRELRPDMSADALRSPRVVAGLAPATAVTIGLGLAIALENPWMLFAVPTVLVAMATWAYAHIDLARSGFLSAVVVVIGLAFEVYVGAALLIWTFGIGYLIAVGLVAWASIATFRRRLAAPA